MHEKRLDIQGLRGWAVTSVVLFHFFPDYFPNGYIGVDMFFVISGFLMSMILRRTKDLNFESLCIFYYRRTKRIMPLYYLAINCILVSLFLLLPTSFRETNIQSSGRAILLITNIKKVDPAQSYSKMLSNAEDLFTHTWSLCVEMQWYLLVPIIFLGQRFMTRWEKTFFISIATCSIVYYFVVNDMSSFYSVFARIWQFSCGIIAHIAHPGKKIGETTCHKGSTLIEPEDCIAKKQILAWDDVRSMTSLCIFSLAVLLPFLPIQLPADCVRIYVTGFSALLIVSGNYHQTFLLLNSISIYVGNISYALYLFHWPVYVIVKHYSAELPHALLLGLLFSITLAAAAYHFFETYYLTWPAYVVWPVLILLGVSCAVFVLQPQNVEEQNFPSGSVDYTKINPLDAAWNMSGFHLFV
ncbi:hypothetical protein Y032_0232g3025 [Ancylostoma ceylanicum]|uniref:Acyltransferase 3 domain-containing protein n=1 Tax=Ancylostoma ceylanicum TaxID=53326 RepID=A0A016SGF3_9BILA|nr:hypothetical protein Y032_0232g3025 [Ancylostoma ceylanicum]